MKSFFKYFKVIIFLNDNYEKSEILTNRIKFYFGNSINVIQVKYSKFSFFFFYCLPILKIYNIDVKPKFRKNIFSKFWFNINPNQNPHDAWVYHTILNFYFPRNINLLKIKFVKAIDEIKLCKKNKTYVFGTGASLDLAINLITNDGYVVVCNTIVKDEILWKHLEPDIIVAGDALYHFSDANFAKRFRNDLIKCLENTTKTYFIFPAFFAPFLFQYIPENLHNRLIGIPPGNHKDISVNLINNFELPSSGNVLSYLLFPIAATLSKRIYLFGFDGRANTDKNFWKNSDKHFYNDEVDELKENHPAFFELFLPSNNGLNYSNTFFGDSLEQALQIAEGNGFYIEMLHNSHTIPLQRRVKSCNLV